MESEEVFKATEEQITANENGICLACGALVEGGIEPDAREYVCEGCGKAQVYGLPEALIMGRLEIAADDE